MAIDNQQEINKLQTDLAELQGKFVELQKKFTIHQHTNSDGSVSLNEPNIFLKEKHVVASGNSAFFGVNVDGQYNLILATGPEVNGQSQVVGDNTTDVQVQLTKTQTYSMFWGVDNISQSDCTKRNVYLSAGQTVFTDQELDLGDVNSKAGYHFVFQFSEKRIIGSTPVDTFDYIIESNTPHSITLKTAIGYSGKLNNYSIGRTVQLGNVIFPWKKLLVEATDTGGVRFGSGNSFNGQNTLLYEETDGTSIGSIYLHTDGSGYATGDICNIIQSGASGGKVTIGTVDGSGAVVTYFLTGVGTGYSVVDGLSTTNVTGSGSGAKFNVTSLARPGGLFYRHLNGEIEAISHSSPI